MTQTSTKQATKPVKYVLAVGVNLPNDKRPRIERGEQVTEADFPSAKSFAEHVKLGTIVKAGSAEGKAAIADAPKGGE